MKPDTTARLLITCPDQPGIVAAVSNLLYNHGTNITALDQHSTDPADGTFFMRLEFQTPHLDISRDALERSFGEESLHKMHRLTPDGPVQESLHDELAAAASLKLTGSPGTCQAVTCNGQIFSVISRSRRSLRWPIRSWMSSV